MNSYIVVCDPEPLCEGAPAPPFREGDVLDEANARRWEAAGVLLLPVCAANLPQRGATGSVASTAYQRRAYGSDGVPFAGAVFARGCAVPICLPTPVARVEWMAGLSLAHETISAQLRLASEESAGGHLRVSEVTTGRGPARDILRGAAIVSGTERCFGAACLAGACAGVRVLWLALTVLPQ